MNFSKLMLDGKISEGTRKILSIIAIACSCLGTLLTIVFTSVCCGRGKAMLMKAVEDSDGEIKGSLAIIGVIIGVVFCIAGLVLAILSMDRNEKVSKIVIIALVVAFVGIVYGIIPNVTMCAYRCSLNSLSSDASLY